MSIKKKFLKSKEICKVTFRIPADAVNGHKKAELLGSFNDWKPEPMKSLKDGSFKLVKDLDKGNSYEFRYLLDGKKWINDEEADELKVNETLTAHNGILHV